jgi:hypothetical protein
MKIPRSVGALLLYLSSTQAYTPNPLDILSIQHSLSSYAVFIDFKNLEALNTVFAPNAVANLPVPGEPLAVGLNQIIQQLNHSIFNQTSQHAISSQVVNVINDTYATSIDYFTATFFGKDELLNQTCVIYGRSDDEWGRNSTDESFLITNKNESYIVS